MREVDSVAVIRDTLGARFKVTECLQAEKGLTEIERLGLKILDNASFLGLSYFSP